MAQVRFIGPEPHIVPWLGPEFTVEPDQVVTVPDRDFDAYVCQPHLWEPVEEPRTPAPGPDPLSAAAPRRAPRSSTRAGTAGTEGGE